LLDGLGGSVREDDHDRLPARIRQQGPNPETYDRYLDLRKHGPVPHGGFGLGVERTLAWITSEKHIRQCIPFPRMRDKVYI
jgi:asparaginyl-tRNA synthetase